MKDKLKKDLKTKPEFDAFLNSNESVLFGYQIQLKDDDYHVYLRKTYDLQLVNIFDIVQIRSAAKSLMYWYFKYCDKNDIEMFLVKLIRY
jgi:hypothetical protein